MTIAALHYSEGQFPGNSDRKTTENTVKLCDGSVGSIVAFHCNGGERSVVVTTLVTA